MPSIRPSQLPGSARDRLAWRALSSRQWADARPWISLFRESLAWPPGRPSPAFARPSKPDRMCVFRLRPELRVHFPRPSRNGRAVQEGAAQVAGSPDYLPPQESAMRELPLTLSRAEPKVGSWHAPEREARLRSRPTVQIVSPALSAQRPPPESWLGSGPRVSRRR